jgi:signal-transduction protein with cAMP-binding, CBS, and nucleotidyltransferase domain
MSIGEICNREVIVIEQGSTIMEAARLMRNHHVGTLVVVEKIAPADNVIPVGILTDRDIVIEMIAEEVDFDAVAIRDVMSYELVTARESDGIWDTMQRMRAQGIRRIPVVSDAGTLVGILAIDDLLELLAEELTDLAKLIRREHQREEKKRD